MEGSSLWITVSVDGDAGLTGIVIRVVDMLKVQCYFGVTCLVFMVVDTHSTQWEDPRLTAKNKPTAVSSLALSLSLSCAHSYSTCPFIQRIQYSRDYKQKYTNFKSKLAPKVFYNYHFLRGMSINTIFSSASMKYLASSTFPADVTDSLRTPSMSS